MKELFDRHAKKMTDSEDRRTWQAMFDATRQRKSGWSRWRIPSLIAAPALVAVLGIALIQQGRIAGPADQMVAGELKQPGTLSEDNLSLPEEAFADAPGVDSDLAFKAEGQADGLKNSRDGGASGDLAKKASGMRGAEGAPLRARVDGADDETAAALDRDRQTVPEAASPAPAGTAARLEAARERPLDAADGVRAGAAVNTPKATTDPRAVGEEETAPDAMQPKPSTQSLREASRSLKQPVEDVAYRRADIEDDADALEQQKSDANREGKPSPAPPALPLELNETEAPAQAKELAAATATDAVGRSTVAADAETRSKDSNTTAATAGVIRGRVTTTTGEPLAYANVLIDGTTLGALTDTSGVFQVNDVPPGTHRVLVSYLGFETVEWEFTLAEGAEFATDVMLTELQAPIDYATILEAKRDLAKKAKAYENERLVLAEPKRRETEERLTRERARIQDMERQYAGKGEGERDADLADAKTAEESRNQTMRALPYLGESPPKVTPVAGARPSETTVGRSIAPATPAPADVTDRMAHGGTDPVNGAAFDAMFFEHYGVNPFIDPLDDNLATFAVDVDNASYTLTRAYLNRGAVPPKEAVRVEEFINSFDHRYPAPAPLDVASRDRISQHGTFAIHTAGAPSPFGENLYLVRVGLKGREIDVRDRKPAMLTFVVDVSGSMAREDRLGLVQQALSLLLDQTRSTDEIAIVVYGSDARTLLPFTRASERARIQDAIDHLIPEGSTNAEAGLRRAYALASESHRPGYINRIILCSDGVANVGNTGAEDILNVIKRESARGIELTTIGFGMGNYNDVLMEKLANNGDGGYYYVDELKEARRVFVENLTGTLQTIAKQTKVQVEFNADTVRRYRLLGYENRDVADRDFRNDAIDAGEVGAGHEVTALFEVRLERRARTGDLAMVRLRYEDPETGRVTEEARAIRVEDLSARFDTMPADFRMDAAVAEFAEILRHSYWARDSKLAPVLGLARDASRELGYDEDLQELTGLIEQADRLWPRDEAWKYTVEPSWSPESDRNEDR